jgi:hypothetical protein
VPDTISTRCLPTLLPRKRVSGKHAEEAVGASRPQGVTESVPDQGNHGAIMCLIYFRRWNPLLRV